jgi:hypothetical protein
VISVVNNALLVVVKPEVSDLATIPLCDIFVDLMALPQPQIVSGTAKCVFAQQYRLG